MSNHAELLRTELEPFGVVVEAVAGGDDIRRMAPDTLADWTREARVLVLRGFDLLTVPELVEYCRTWGSILTWDFGEVLDLVVEEDPANYLFAPGDVPFHWDGAFAEGTPSFFLFQCVDAPPAGGGGETVFCDTTRVLAEVGEERRAAWRSLELVYSTDKLAHYGGHVTVPLLATHPRTGAPTIRYAEPLPAGRYLNPLEVAVSGWSDAQTAELVEELRELLHQDRFCYAHDWRKGDIVIVDNHALVHGRNAFTSKSTRHLQRIQIIEEEQDRG